MNVTEDKLKEFGFDKHIAVNEVSMRMIFGASESLLCFNTVQFKDYSKIVAIGQDVEAKARRIKEVFPVDCQKAFDMGVRFATNTQYRTNAT
ncbi:MAG TPA: hypothetical protein VN370_12905 [Desulfitobacteriaceae bacterium]|nr:hypothetical protein [Desulfitobacteriaceae bacterium]